MFSIGELSVKSGVKIPTVRYYEKMNLMSEPMRTAGNQRRYAQSALEQLVFIKHARDLGFSMSSVSKLIALSGSQEKSCHEIDALAKGHLEQVRIKLSLLKSLESELIRITSGCRNDQVDKCYVIESLASHDMCSSSH